MLYDGKMKRSYLRSNSNTAHFAQTHQVPFRTILKRRNDTISSSQLYEDQPLSKEKNTSHHLSHSQIISQKQIEQPPPSVAIKDYVKKMGNKPEPKRTHAKIQMVDVPKIEDDRLSQKSSRSVISNSHILKKEAAPLFKVDRGAIEQLEKRVQALICESLGQLKRQKSTIGISQWLKTEPAQEEYREKELQQLVAWLKEMSEKEEVAPERCDDLNKKIVVIEKLLARESVESQLLQGIYFNWKAQRGNTTSFLSKSVLKESKRYNKPSDDQHRKLYKQAIKSRQIVSKYDSTNSTSFKKPSKQYYILSKEKKDSYSANRQPFPRSSYSAQYLNYGQFSTYSYKQADTKQYPDTSLAVKASTYQEEYTEKLGLTKKIDFKDQDCYRDKFQNPKISFMCSSKKQGSAKIEQKKHGQSKKKEVKQNLDAAYIKKSQESLLGYMSMSSSSFFKSEHQKQYYWHNMMNSQSSKELNLKSQIKDKRLDRLKESFRALALRR